MDSIEEKKFSKKQMLAFAETCMLNLLTTKTETSDCSEISSYDLYRIKQVLNKFNKDE